MKSLIIPYMARIAASDGLQGLSRCYARSLAKLQGKWPTIEVYLHPGDPYSHLLLQVLPNLQSRFAIQVRIYWLDALEAEMFPEPALLQNYAYRDNEYLAKQYQLNKPVKLQVSKNRQLQVCCILQSIADNRDTSLTHIVEKSLELLDDVSKHEDVLFSEAKISSDSIQANNQRLQKLGHYSPAMIYFAGEWYWGLDRLAHLESRLNHAGLAQSTPEIQFNKHLTLPESHTNTSLKDKTLTLYWSARSPYSYLALLRCCDLAKHYQFTLDVKPIMPMVMRGLPVPEAKKMYIFKDTKREANRLNIDYGFVADPLGAAVIRCYSLLDFARQHNHYLDFLVSFSKAVNAEGVRAETDKGLKLIIERAGLNWHKAQKHLTNESWKQETEEHLQTMTIKGLWGVPCIEFEDEMVWGQDRIPYIMQLMLNSKDKGQSM